MSGVSASGVTVRSIKTAATTAACAANDAPSRNDKRRPSDGPYALSGRLADGADPMITAE
jgi:hypothetical protein